MELLHFVEYCICSFMAADSRVYSAYFECFVATVVVHQFEAFYWTNTLSWQFSSTCMRNLCQLPA